MSHSAATTTRDPRLNAQIDALLAGHHSDPFALLGPHPVEGNWVVRFFLPWAAEASISLSPPAAQGTTPAPAIVTGAVKLRPEGFFEVIWPSSQSGPPAPAAYKIRGRTHFGEPYEIYDPYAFPCVLTEFDLHLMGEGRHYDTYEKLGAHVITLEGVRGVHFAVWVPSARRVSVVGDFNRSKAPSTSTKSSARTAAYSPSKPIPTLSAQSYARKPGPSSPGSILIPGTTRIGSRTARKKTGSNRPSPYTKFISAPGAASPKTTIAG